MTIDITHLPLTFDDMANYTLTTYISQVNLEFLKNWILSPRLGIYCENFSNNKFPTNCRGNSRAVGTWKENKPPKTSDNKSQGSISHHWETTIQSDHLSIIWQNKSQGSISISSFNCIWEIFPVVFWPSLHHLLRTLCPPQGAAEKRRQPTILLQPLSLYISLIRGRAHPHSKPGISFLYPQAFPPLFLFWAESSSIYYLSYACGYSFLGWTKVGYSRNWFSTFSKLKTTKYLNQPLN